MNATTVRELRPDGTFQEIGPAATDNDGSEANAELLFTESDKFVVLHDGLWKYRRGDVLSVAELGGIESVQRHLRNRAIRLTWRGENEKGSVRIADENRDISYEQRLAEKDYLIRSLESRIHQLEGGRETVDSAQLVSLRAQVHQMTGMLGDKDRLVSDLTERCKDYERQLETRQEEHAATVAECELLRNKIGLMEASRSPNVDEMRAKIAEATGQKVEAVEQTIEQFKRGARAK